MSKDEKKDRVKKIVEEDKKYENVAILRNDASGHQFPDGGTLGSHFNDGEGRHFFYTSEQDKKDKK